MKKLLRNLIPASAFLLILNHPISAQLPNGSIAPAWTFTDMNGKSHSLYNYLDSGYSVIMDVSATWCAPCWGYHQSGALESLYSQHGPSGTNDVRVFWVEGDGATSDGCMINSGCVDANHNNTSQGNWLNGVTFPMINPPTAQANTFNNNYAIGFFPTVYRICPNRTLNAITQPTASEAYAECQTCPPPASQANDPTILQYKGTKISCGNVSIKVFLQNNGISPLTACTITATMGGNQVAQLNWTGNLAKYATQIVTVGTTTISATSDISISITSPDDNSSNNTITQNVIYKQPQFLPVAEGFENSSLPNAWDQENKDADGVEWIINQSYGGFGASSSSAFLELYSSSTGNIDNLNTTVYDFSNTPTPIKMIFDVAYAQYSNENDKLIVKGSSNCGSTWTTKYNKAGSTLKTAPPTTTSFKPTATQWRTDTADFSSFAGQSKVLIQFNATSDFGNNLYLDNVRIWFPITGDTNNNGIIDGNEIAGDVNGNGVIDGNELTGDLNGNGTINVGEVLGDVNGNGVLDPAEWPAGLNNLTENYSVKFFPNPSSGVLNIEFLSPLKGEVEVSVFNILGKMVCKNIFSESSLLKSTMNLQNLDNGIYFLSVSNERGGSGIQKLILNK